MTIISLLKASLSFGIFIILSWAIFYFAGAFWGVAWLVLNALCLIPFFVRFVWRIRRR